MLLVSSRKTLQTFHGKVFCHFNNIQSQVSSVQPFFRRTNVNFNFLDCVYSCLHVQKYQVTLALCKLQKIAQKSTQLLANRQLSTAGARVFFVCEHATLVFRSTITWNSSWAPPAYTTRFFMISLRSLLRYCPTYLTACCKALLKSKTCTPKVVCIAGYN